MADILDLILVLLAIALVVPVMLARAARWMLARVPGGVNALARLADIARAQADEIMSRPEPPAPRLEPPVPAPVPAAARPVLRDTGAVSAGSGAGTGTGAPVPSVPDDVLLVLLANQRQNDTYRFTANELATLFGGNRAARLATIRAVRETATYLDNLTPAQRATRAELDAG